MISGLDLLSLWCSRPYKLYPEGILKIRGKEKLEVKICVSDSLEWMTDSHWRSWVRWHACVLYLYLFSKQRRTLDFQRLDYPRKVKKQ